MIITYEKVEFHAGKDGKCDVCGKHVVRRRTFWHTVNPWNTNEDGTMKTRDQILDDVIKEAVAWRKVPPVHARCEP